MWFWICGVIVVSSIYGMNMKMDEQNARIHEQGKTIRQLKRELALKTKHTEINLVV